MSVSTIGVVLESTEGERLVALSPDGVQRLRKAGHEVLVETGAGASAWFPDSEYEAAGARLVSRPELYGRADAVLCVQAPAEADRTLLRTGQVLVGLLQPLTDPKSAAGFAVATVTAISLDGLPRTVSRAQSMDALSSQANVAGYKAALVAADTYSNYLPMFMTAAGTTRPALVLVIGAGVAGLQAIGTARRLGAIVTGYDVRDAARGDVLSTGATFLDLGVQVSAVGEGGYARELTAEERHRQQDALNAAMSKFDIVITTAQVPGRRPPLLVSATALAGMRAGSVVVDLGSSALGGNVEGSKPGENVVTANGVTVVGAANLPSAVPKASSTAYSRNLCALLAHLISDGELNVDPADEITAGVLITHRGEVVHPAVRALLGGVPETRVARRAPAGPTEPTPPMPHQRPCRPRKDRPDDAAAVRRHHQMKDMEEANPEFSRTDVVLVVGANDVANPAARRPGNSVTGMPILNVDEAARSVIVIKRSMGHGYAGIDHELYTDPKTAMLFGDAKVALTALVAGLDAYVN